MSFIGSSRLLKFIFCVVLLGGTGLQLGCASGGYKMTRKFSGFVNKQNIIIRIILYIVAVPIYGITLALDAVIFNTMDFWEGRVSANTYNFEKDGQKYIVKHFYKGEEKLRNTQITFQSEAGEKQKELLISEAPDGRIKVYVDGKFEMIIKDINDLPLLKVS